MAMKFVILCGLFAIALGSAIPEQYFEEPSNLYEVAYEQQAPAEYKQILVRNARSPQRQVDANVEHSSRHGTSASVNYNHPLGKNVDAYVGASRNFKYNDNSGHVGLRYRF